MAAAKPLYDVAFSFLAEDEGLANELDALLGGRFSTFVFSKQQEKLAGRDGEETLNRVFGVEARVVVVLYRKGWGETPFTRIEDTAIRNRAFQKGYDFTLFIPLDTPPAAPEWLPRPRIWFGLERYGLDVAVAIIEQLIEGGGGAARSETAADRAQRLADDLATEGRREQLRRSNEGASRATAAVTTLFAELRRLATPVAGGLAFEVTADRDGLAVYAKGFTLMAVWSMGGYVGTLDYARMHVKLWSGRPDFAGVFYVMDAKELGHWKFAPDFDSQGAVVWHEGGAKTMTTEKLADEVFSRLIGAIRLATLGR